MRESRRANSLETRHAIFQHAVFAESRETRAELVEAVDMVPLWELGGVLGALGVFEGGAGAVEVQFLEERVEDVDC